MGLIYSTSQTSTANSTSADSVSLKAVNNSFIVREFVISGLATASAANEILLQRNTAGTVATAMVARNVNVSASITQFGLAQATTPTASTVMARFGVNGNGALYRWTAAPGLAVEVKTAGQVGWRGVSGTSLLTTEVTIEEF